ncbi:GDSL esterase/lipase At2g31540 [Actinidia eriantha]|uniref:GDSL esterase/lipase At2g31540 n=1 Tax=Actinidia eriantha TaxID=165200 RepID=UPI00258DA3CF|nr:GDSL esterase/lipase At2g31540 [Actinidia eriantha]
MSLTLFFILLVLLCPTTTKASDGATLPKFSAILIFGDSLLDTGNNNFIPTLVKANYLPYGQDFPGRIPTGRFSNGKLMSDILASALGIKDTVPAFLDPNLPNTELKTGVCFASAGSGYDDLTTVNSGVIPVSRQPDYFRNYIEKLKEVEGEEKANNIIEDSLVLIFSGSNDVAINYYFGFTRRAQFPNIGGYHDFLQEKLQDFVKELYSLGCRNMLIAGLPPMGFFNYDSQSYNFKLGALLHQLQASLPGSKLVYADIYNPLYDMATNPLKYGFMVENRGCCGAGIVGGGPFCSPFIPVCANPSQYLLWDSIHPGESAYRYISQDLLENALPQFSQQR